MIVFNDTALETVAPVMVEDIRVSPIALNVTARERPVRFGSDFVRLTGGRRTVSLTFSVLSENMELRAQQLQAITDWARTETEGKLMLPMYPGKFLTCICTALPEPSARQWWESKLRLTFSTISDPYWNDTAEKSAACGTAFTVLGSAPPEMRIVRTLSAAASSQAYSDGQNTMTFSTIPAGDLEIDLNYQTAAVTANNVKTSIMQYYAFDSKFIIPHTGAMTITGTGTVKWRERWQ